MTGRRHEKGPTGLMAMLRYRRQLRKAIRLWLFLSHDILTFGVHSVELVN